MAVAKYHKPTGVYPSVFEVPYQELIDAGVVYFAFDVDNTLGDHNILELSKSVWRLFGNIYKAGGEPWLVSNNPLNRSKLRDGVIEVFHPRSHVHLLLMHKPSKKYYQKLLKKLGARPEQAVMIGDDYHRDVNGAIKAGMGGYLINPIGEPIWLDRRRRRRPKTAKKLKKLFGITWPIHAESKSLTTTRP